jgi:hypothetical protein
MNIVNFGICTICYKLNILYAPLTALSTALLMAMLVTLSKRYIANINNDGDDTIDNTRTILYVHIYIYIYIYIYIDVEIRILISSGMVSRMVSRMVYIYICI